MIDREKQEADARLEAWLGSAPLPPASPGFCARVMRAIEARPAPWPIRLRRFLFSPHALRWNVAGAAAAAITVSGLAIGLALLVGRAPAPTDGTVTVRFAIALPQARQVRLAGDFTQWQPRIPLRRGADGNWVAEIPLPPGNYEYVFVVDDQRWITDPRAGRYRDDGFGNRNAVLTVTSM